MSANARRAGEAIAPWQELDRRLVYDSAWIRLWLARVRLPDGSVIADYHVVDYPRQAVGIVPVGSDGRVLLIDQYRFITGRRSWCIPSGTVDDGEALDAATRRELQEEAGATADELVYLGHYYPSHGSSNQVFHLFVGRSVQVHETPPDRNEVEGVRWFAVEEVRRMIHTNRIPDGLSLTALLWALDAGYLERE